MTNAPILVIDDDPSIRETVASILGDEGYLVRTAQDGAEGLASVREEQPALILIDRWMPVLDGLGFVRALPPQKQAIPLIAMTASQDAAQWAQEIGAVAVLPKPFKLEHLLALVTQALGDTSPGSP